jgi:plasmid maintenance system antidote protein VapI
MAVRIAKSTNTTPESWLNMQVKLDLWNIKQNKIIKTIPFKSHVA